MCSWITSIIGQVLKESLQSSGEFWKRGCGCMCSWITSIIGQVLKESLQSSGEFWKRGCGCMYSWITSIIRQVLKASLQSSGDFWKRGCGCMCSYITSTIGGVSKVIVHVQLDNFEHQASFETIQTHIYLVVHTQHMQSGAEKMHAPLNPHTQEPLISLVCAHTLFFSIPPAFKRMCTCTHAYRQAI